MKFKDQIQGKPGDDTSVENLKFKSLEVPSNEAAIKQSLKAERDALRKAREDERQAERERERQRISRRGIGCCGCAC